MSINAGRTVIREGDDPHMVIFIVTGEIEMSKIKFTKVNRCYNIRLLLLLNVIIHLGF